MNYLSLNGVLAYLDRDDLDESEQLALRSTILEKVDEYAVFERQLCDEVKRLREIAKEFTEAARVSEKRLERFHEHVKYVMEANGFEKLPGAKFEVQLRENPPKVIVDQEPTSFDAEAYPSLVRTKWEWNKSVIKDMLAERDIPFARLVRERRAVFAVRKGI